MNHYGSRAHQHWARQAPQRVARMEDPERFFTELGRQVQDQISDLTRQMETALAPTVARTGSLGENGDYLEGVARRMTAARIAEEVVMDQLVWIHDPSLSTDEARAEWDAIRPMNENLITWAETIQDDPQPPATVEIEDKAAEWAVPVWFLENLISAEIPRTYANQHQKLLEQAASVRFLREVR